MPEPRTAVQKMRPYYPPTGNRQEFLRLDFNENTIGCPEHVLNALKMAITGDLLATYPDYGVAKEKLSEFFGVREEQLLLTNGTDEAIQLIVNTFVEPGDEVIVLHPTYAMYRFYAEVAGAIVREVRYRDLPGSTEYERILQVEAQDVLAIVSNETKAVFLPNPNNPTGSTISIEAIQMILAERPKVCVLIDEAYFDFWGSTALSLINKYENLFVSRTFSKAFGLAGLRFGCVMSHDENIKNMKKAQSPYSVNTLATVAGLAAIENRDWIREYSSQVQMGRSLLERELGEHGYAYWKSDANFVLFDAGDRADELLELSREAGVLIRDRRHDLPGALRVTAGTPEHAQRFASILEVLP